jgi:hypothetical protein
MDSNKTEKLRQMQTEQILSTTDAREIISEKDMPAAKTFGVLMAKLGVNPICWDKKVQASG